VNAAADAAAGASADGAGTGPVLIVGTGLIGASVGLALSAAGVPVQLTDRDAAAVALATDLGAGRPYQQAEDPAVVVIAAPPSAVATLALEFGERHPAAVLTDVASVKATIVEEFVRLGGDAARFVGGHPVAGREVSGAAAAQSDLFEGRPWVLTPEAAGPDAVDAVAALAALTGATVVRMSAERHDAAMALVSHAPQVTAATLAAVLTGADADLVALAGGGLRDTTRIADSDPVLWSEILLGNAVAVTATLDLVAGRLQALRSAIASGSAAEVQSLLAAGVAGRQRIPGKHGGRAHRYAVVTVIIPDRAGALGRLLATIGEIGVNIEDLRLEHSPGQAAGLVELSVEPGDAARLAGDLGAAGWRVH
jgi:prephenate dehydrogenase